MHEWERLLDDARADASASARVRQRWLERQATEGATLVGTLLDLAEPGVPVSVWTSAGRRHEGDLAAIGADFLLLADRGDHVAIRLAAVAMVRPQTSGASPASGDRAAALDLNLAELLARVVDARPAVSLAIEGAEPLNGSLRAVGVDVLTLQVAPGDDGVVYVSVDRCASVRFRSG